jgi:hypothetical protein
MLIDYGINNGDSNFTSNTTGGSMNATLGFAFPYQNSIYTSVSINVNGYVSLNGGTTTTIYAYVNNFTGTVFYRQMSKATQELAVASRLVRTTFNNLFIAAEAFLITWYSYIGKFNFFLLMNI